MHAVQYMAPEQFNGARVDEKVDVYALGVILNEAYTRRPPWKESTHFFQIILKVDRCLGAHSGVLGAADALELVSKAREERRSA